MKQRPRIYYTEEQKALMWDRWQKGESLNSIARQFDRHHSAIAGILSRTGGIRPALRRRSRRSLTLVEREEISRGIVSGCSMRSIAAALGRSPSTSPSPGIVAKRWPITSVSRWRPISRFTSVIRTILGSVVPMRTPMDC